MSWAEQLVIALAIFAGGTATGIRYHVGVVASRDLAALQASDSDRKQQRQFNDVAAGKHAAAVSVLSNQLGNARAYIAKLSDRECLDAGAVGVLNAIGVQPGGAVASESASTSAGVAAGTGIRFATERDTASAIAVCRARYSEVSSQVNQILDIEERRSPLPE